MTEINTLILLDSVFKIQILFLKIFHRNSLYHYKIELSKMKYQVNDNSFYSFNIQSQPFTVPAVSTK